ncbi:MAG: hypothetical protein ACI8P3_001509 [Saprospiraceae bacterium]|jgi:hypothetical protein
MLMQKNISTLLLGIFACAGIFMSFQDTDHAIAIQRLVDKEVERQIERYRSIRIKKCEEKIMEAADTQADSIIITLSRNLKILQDTFDRPVAPGRPIPPDLLEPIDSSSPAPLLHNEEDTLDSSGGRGEG